MSVKKTQTMMTEVSQPMTNRQSGFSRRSSMLPFLTSRDSSAKRSVTVSDKKNQEQDLQTFYNTFTSSVVPLKKRRFDSYSQKKQSIDKAEKRLTTNFLEIQKLKTVQNAEQCFIPSTVRSNNFKLRNIENKSVFLDFVSTHQNKLVELKKQFHELQESYKHELSSFEVSERSLENLKNSLNPSSTVTIIDSSDDCQEELTRISYLEHLEKTYLLDLVTIKKRNTVMKNWFKGLDQRMKIAIEDLERENSAHRKTVRFETKRFKNKTEDNRTNPFTDNGVRIQLSQFIENVHINQMIVQENRRALQSIKEEEEKLKAELAEEKIRLNREFENQIQINGKLQQELNDSNLQMTEITKLVRATNKSKIISEISETKFSNSLLINLKNELVAETFNIPKKRNQSLSEKQSDELSPNNDQHLNNNLSELESTAIYTILHNEKELNRLETKIKTQQDRFFQAKGTFARTLYQLDPEKAQTSHYSSMSIGELLEEIKTQISISINKIRKESKENFNINSGHFNNLPNYDLPKTLLRLHPGKGSSETVISDNSEKKEEYSLSPT